MKRFLTLILVAMTSGAFGEELVIDRSRARDLSTWKPAIQNYSNRHYGEYTWKLEPRCIVLHYTAGTDFPWNLVESTEFKGETPGLAVHYIVDGTKIWQILPDDVRSRGAYGINHVAINIEMIAADANDLAGRPRTLETTARLVKMLMARHGVGLDKIYSHQEVATMDPAVVPEVKDLVAPGPYDKIDPGVGNMNTIKAMLSEE